MILFQLLEIELEWGLGQWHCNVFLMFVRFFLEVFVMLGWILEKGWGE